VFPAIRAIRICKITVVRQRWQCLRRPEIGGSPVRLFANQYLAEVAIGHFVPPGIGEIEGVGVQPDVAVAPRIRFCRGTAPQLAAALELAQQYLAHWN
jgi:C-terminal processing protease CtpA/Prc